MACIPPNPKRVGYIVPIHGPLDRSLYMGSIYSNNYLTSGGSCLTKAQDEKVLEMAHTYRSQVPLCVAVMKRTNVDVKGCYIVSCIIF